MIYKNEDGYFTYDQLKERILSYKDQEPDEKNSVQDVCCICMREINSWFHGQGRTCSPECNFIFNQIYNIKDNPNKDIFNKLRKELWEGRGWINPNKEMNEAKRQMDNNEKVIILDKIIENAAWACEQLRNDHDTSKHERLSLCIIFMELMDIKKSTSVDEMIKLIKNKIKESK